MNKDWMIDRINNCLLGAQIGSILGHKLEGSLTCINYQKIEKKYGLINDILDERFFDKNLDFEISEIALKAYLRKQGRINYRDFSKVLVNEYNTDNGLEKFLNKEDFLAPTYYELRNICELIKKGVPEKIAGYFNIISSSGMCIAIPIGIFNIFDPEQAFYDGMEVTSSFQREIGRWCPAIFSVFVSSVFDENKSFKDLLKITLKYSDIDVNIFNETKIKNANISNLIENILNISSKYNDPIEARQELERGALKGWKSIFHQEPLNVLQIVFGILNITGFDFERSVIGAANMSGNSTTIGLLCGAAAGARSDLLPERWVKKIPIYRKVKIKKYAQDLYSLVLSENSKRKKWIEEMECVL